MYIFIEILDRAHHHFIYMNKLVLHLFMQWVRAMEMEVESHIVHTAYKFISDSYNKPCRRVASVHDVSDFYTHHTPILFTLLISRRVVSFLCY